MRIIFTKQAWHKIHLYIEHAEGEVSGLGVAELCDNEDLIVKDVGIWEQECTSAYTEVNDHDAMLKLAEELIAKGAKSEEICVWWHSHADMASSFSTTDDESIEQWVNNRFLAAVCGNKAGQYVAKVSIKKPIKCIIKDVPVQVEPDYYPKKLDDEIKAEVKDKVKERKYDYKDSGWKSGKWTNYGKDEGPKTISKKEQKRINKKANKEILKLDKKQRELRDVYNAQYCLCDSCAAYLAEEQGYVDYQRHNFDPTTNIWVPRDQEQVIISRQRTFTKDYKQQTIPV